MADDAESDDDRREDEDRQTDGGHHAVGAIKRHGSEVKLDRQISISSEMSRKRDGIRGLLLVCQST